MLSEQNITSKWSDDDKVLNVVFDCPCGCELTVKYYVEDRPMIRSYGVFGEKNHLLFNNRPYDERTYNLYYNYQSIYNVPYDSIRYFPGAEKLPIGEVIRDDGPIIIERASNIKPKGRLFRRVRS